MIFFPGFLNWFIELFVFVCYLSYLIFLLTPKHNKAKKEYYHREILFR